MRKALNQYFVGAKPRKLAKRFARGERGNVLLMTAALLVPILAIIGSGIDMGRSYMTQLRLQQACDAGALAGRRAMAVGEYTTANKLVAEKMFNFNFPAGMYGTQNVSFTSKLEGPTDVVGTAKATLPTALMHIFGYDQFVLERTCGAKLEIANTDVMLVLDVTGSMNNETTFDGQKITRAAALILAAKVFVSELASADKGDGTLRMGMVPYSNTVNVGHLLKNEWMVDDITIPSHESIAKENCTTRKGVETCTTSYTNKLKDVKFDVSALRVGNQFDKAIGWNQSLATGKWEGCIVERETTPFKDGDLISNDAYDMDLDLVPTGDPDTQWKPYLPHLVFERSSVSESNSSSSSKSILAKARSATGSQHGNYAPNYGRCAPPAMKLTEMNEEGRALLETSLDGLNKAGVSPYGSTYLDAGIAWGGRLLSPTGLFATDNAEADNKRPIGRHLVFMTDGNMDVKVPNYSIQGYERTEKRVTGYTGTPSESSLESNMQTRHLYRFRQLCERVKQLGTDKDGNVTIWVIAFGASATDLATLRSCSSSGVAHVATDGTQLRNIFKTIAGQISRLRVSQ
jgi:Flp pilus assembly protein TadG